VFVELHKLANENGEISLDEDMLRCIPKTDEKKIKEEKRKKKTRPM
jgi:hypothetical protein